MSPRSISIIIKSILGLFGLLILGGVWWFAWGRKPSLQISMKISAKEGTPSAHLLNSNEVVLITRNKACLFELGSGQQVWNTALGPAIAAKPAATPPPATPTPPPADEKPDPMLVKRVERRFAKLEAWAQRLNERRDKLKTPVQIAAFNEEAAKYHAELTAARAEAAPLHHTASLPHLDLPEPEAGEDPFWGIDQTVAAARLSNSVLVARDRQALIFDRANGRLTREYPLATRFTALLKGPNCFYLRGDASGGHEHVVCINAADGSARNVQALGSEQGPGYHHAGEGLPDEPNVQSEFSALDAAGGELAEMYVRLVARKVTEKQVISGDSTTDFAKADAQMKGGWGGDALILAQAMAKDRAREATGGKERYDESTYDVVLRRPFASSVPPIAPIRVQGRPHLFSTPNMDVVFGGATVYAFDHSNRKLWESKLPQAPRFSSDARSGEFPGSEAQSDTVATPAHPVAEDPQRLYFFDRSFLTALDRASGRPLWRLPSVGIAKLQLDGRGTLYLLSTESSAESVHTGGDLSATLQLIKIDARTGKIGWRTDRYDDAFVSGGDLYGWREAKNPNDLVDSVFERDKAPPQRFKVFKLSTWDGKPQWEWFQPRHPLSVQADRKRVLLVFRDEFQMLKSIAF